MAISPREQGQLRYLENLRRHEMALLVSAYGRLLADKDVIEIGSGTGAQLDALEQVCGRVLGVDVPESNYAALADPRICQYDGFNLPAGDNAFDLAFSSNVLEHIAHRSAFQKELLRVVKPGGWCLHVLPTHRWRLLTMATHLIKSPIFLAAQARQSVRDRRWRLPRSPSQMLELLIGPRHGEFGTSLSEPWHFHPAQWCKVFDEAGWIVEEVASLPLAYSGTCLLADKISLATRERASRILGPSMGVYLLRKPES